MTASSIRSGFIGLAVVAAVLDAIALITGLVSGAALPAILALLAGALTVIGGLWAGNRIRVWAEIQDKQLERANGQVTALTRQVALAAEAINDAGTASASDDSQDVLLAAANTIDTIADASS